MVHPVRTWRSILLASTLLAAAAGDRAMAQSADGAAGRMNAIES